MQAFPLGILLICFIKEAWNVFKQCYEVSQFDSEVKGHSRTIEFTINDAKNISYKFMSLQAKISMRNSRTFSIHEAAFEKYFLKSIHVRCNKTLVINIDPLLKHAIIIEAKLFIEDAEDSFSEYNSGVTGLIKDNIYEIPDRNSQYGLRVQVVTSPHEIIPAGNYPSISRVQRKLSKDKKPDQLLAMSVC
ncbi:hypothetical protein RF11_06347 [Thelohanellus kitauei]|uniref:Uncharacterized protein n=1 Tax=Thelohanellus kitauei TaxID=669202 RepID=A0A0C2J3R5_THEKT|nr:hypothetical protein RF11_06347 [Thelohanellus kitauei]